MPTLKDGLFLSVLLGIATFGFVIVRKRRYESKNSQLKRAEDELHPILKDHTSFRAYSTAVATYTRIRTFYRPHPHKGKHQNIDGLPLLVFIHGLGGVLPQFANTIATLSNISACFGIELPGHGRSDFSPKDFAAYTIEAYALLWKCAVETICSEHGHHEVVLIGHSMGCSIAALLASSEAGPTSLSVPVGGLVAICPRARSPTVDEITKVKRFFMLPDALIGVLRWFDRYGDENSNSVKRVVGDSNEIDLKRMQLGWNTQFRTAVFRRESLGMLPRLTPDRKLVGGYPGQNVWKSVTCPLFLVAGMADTVCKPSEVDLIVKYITTNTALPFEPVSQEHPSTIQSKDSLIPMTLHNRDQIVQIIKLPNPAAHALLYAHATYRLVNGLVEAFLHDHVSSKLDFSYQLQLLTTSGKWDVKNLEKWRKVLPVSAPIHTAESPNGLFRALKTMRAQDDEHNPDRFAELWSDKIYAVVDISHDAPVYDSKILENGNVEYHKFPTVSKIPPTPLEVQDFCALVDKLVAEKTEKHDDRAIGVHCHYGYNRTGFFLISYLVTRKGYRIQQALDAFSAAKKPGIRHEHFIDTLWLRYSGWDEENSHKQELSADITQHLQSLATKAEDANDLTDGDVM